MSTEENAFDDAITLNDVLKLSGPQHQAGPRLGAQPARGQGLQRGIQLLRATGASARARLHFLSARLTGLPRASLMMGMPWLTDAAAAA